MCSPRRRTSAGHSGHTRGISAQFSTRSLRPACSRGSEDAALLVGTGKDLLEATAAHVISERYGSYSSSKFPDIARAGVHHAGLATPQHLRSQPNTTATIRAGLYEAGCAINAMRNRQGTGHGRPWLANVTDNEARSSVQLIGIISGFLLAAHKAKP